MLKKAKERNEMMMFQIEIEQENTQEEIANKKRISQNACFFTFRKSKRKTSLQHEIPEDGKTF